MQSCYQIIRFLPEILDKPDIGLEKNFLMWELFDLLQPKIQRSIKPIQNYIKAYEAYKTLTSPNPDEYVQKLGAGEEVEEKDLRKKISEVKRAIDETKAKEGKIQQPIPESIVVSTFRIKCKDVRKLYEGIYSEIVKENCFIVTLNSLILILKAN